MASKRKNSNASSNTTAVLSKKKSRSLIDSDLNSIANKAKNNDLESNNASNVVELANALESNNDNSNQDSNPINKAVDNTNNNPNAVANNVDANAANVDNSVQKQNNDSNEVNDSQSNNDAENQQNDSNAASNKVVWVKDKNGNRVKAEELKVLQNQWNEYAKDITINEPDGIDLNDATYFPAINWDDYGAAAKKEYKNFDVNKLANTWGKVVGNNDLVLMSEPHNNKKSGFALARKIMNDTKPPGVIMMEAPAAFNQSPDIVKAIGYWGFWKSNDSTFGAFAKEARDKGWKIVAVDATDPKGGKVNSELMTKADMPKNLISANDDEQAVGSKSRQAYIARNVLNTVQDNPNTGAVLLIGTAHIVSNAVPDMSPMISKTKTADAPNQAVLQETNSKGKILKKGRPFRIVEVDTSSDNLLDEVNNDPK